MGRPTLWDRPITVQVSPLVGISSTRGKDEVFLHYKTTGYLYTVYLYHYFTDKNTFPPLLSWEIIFFSLKNHI